MTLFTGPPYLHFSHLALFALLSQEVLCLERTVLHVPHLTLPVSSLALSSRCSVWLSLMTLSWESLGIWDPQRFIHWRYRWSLHSRSENESRSEGSGWRGWKEMLLDEASAVASMS